MTQQQKPYSAHNAHNESTSHTKKSIHWLDALFLGTILFFALSLVHISFALVGLVCFITPLVMALTTGKKLWCNRYCPRASLLKKALSRISLGLKAPNWLYKPATRQGVLTFFCLNLMMATMSTVMVSMDRLPPIDAVRFLMFIQVPIELPQLITLAVPDVITHIGYRIFSIMFSSTVVGLILGLLYKPRTWCAICPVQTVTQMIITPRNT